MNEDLPLTLSEAIKLGTKFYFTGKPCKLGHIDKRYTCNSHCWGCQYDMQYNEKQREYFREYWHKHKNDAIRKAYADLQHARVSLAKQEKRFLDLKARQEQFPDKQIVSRNEARTQGLKKYFTGKPCKFGHIEDRLVSNGRCLICLKSIWSEQKRKYSQKPEWKEYSRKYHYEYSKTEKWKKYYREWYLKDKEKKRLAKEAAKAEINKSL